MKKIVYFMHLTSIRGSQSFRSAEFSHGKHPEFIDWLNEKIEEVEKGQNEKMIITNINILTYEI